ncbi:MAG: N-acetylmuramoyl-L-alanine amidase [Kofleriaceae bacterium]
MQIVIDPGHGGHDARGHSTPYGDRTGTSWEKDLNLRLAERVAAHLGGGAVLTRAHDVNLSLQERADIARRLGARAFVSLHGHAGRGNGEVYVHSRASMQSRALAESVTRELGCKCAPERRDLAVLHPDTLGNAMPACMVELGYDGDLAPHALDRLGASIARGVRTFLDHGAPHSRGLDATLDAAIDACLPVIASAGFPQRQVNRLTCLLQKIRDASVDDRYINGFDSLLRSLGPRLTDDQLDALLNSNRVRDDVLRAAQNPGDIRTHMDLLDQRIMQGISFLNERMYIEGGALSEALLQIKDWVVARQHDQASGYWCYGQGQDAYEGRAHGNRIPMLQARGLDLDLNASIDACVAALASSGFPQNQINRLTCVLQKIRDAGVDDRYVNGFDSLLPTLGPRLDDAQWNAFINQNKVRDDIIYAASHDDIRGNLDLLDQRIMRGISWLNERMYIEGGAMAAALLQIKDWVAARQQDQNSVYWCYGAGQDSYGGATYGNRPRRRDPRSAWG